MTTIVEQTHDGTIYRAPKTYPVPNLDILTLLFGASGSSFASASTSNILRIV
jgi:4-coumarate--CoA ligase